MEISKINTQNDGFSGVLTPFWTHFGPLRGPTWPIELPYKGIPAMGQIPGGPVRDQF